MADRIKFYMDEHIPRAVTDGLRRRGVDVLTAQEAGIHPADDDEHVKLAVREGRVIFTQDMDFLRLHAAGISHRGVVYVPQQTLIGYMVRGLMTVYDILNPEDMVDHVEFL